MRWQERIVAPPLRMLSLHGGPRQGGTDRQNSRAAPPITTQPPALVTVDTEQRAPVPIAFSRPSAASAARLHGDAWTIARPRGGDSLAFGQLGASQAGLRLTYALGDARRVALSARVATPLSGRGHEGAAGLDWRPTPLPVHLLADLRVPLDGGVARPAVQLIGGAALRLPAQLQAEGYAQAGAVSRRGAFVDGATRVTRALFTHGRVEFDMGAGAWGAAQRGVARLDVGPTASVTLPLGAAAIRLGADYRLRLAGRARPGSGPAVTLGSSF